MKKVGIGFIAVGFSLLITALVLAILGFCDVYNLGSPLNTVMFKVWAGVFGGGLGFSLLGGLMYVLFRRLED